MKQCVPAGKPCLVCTRHSVCGLTVTPVVQVTRNVYPCLVWWVTSLTAVHTCLLFLILSLHHISDPKPQPLIWTSSKMKICHLCWVSQVSLGAEVIFLSKRFFLSSCNRLCQEDVFKSRSFYPTQENMQICYRLHMAWKQYTDKVVKELHEDILNEGRQFFGTYFNVWEMILDTTLPNTHDIQRRLMATRELSKLQFFSSKSKDFG